MLKEDEMRLEREAAIARSTRGPDHALLKRSVRAAYAEWDSRDAAALRVWQQERDGYYDAAKRGEIARVDGQIPAFAKPAPGFRSRNFDTGWCMS